MATTYPEYVTDGHHIYLWHEEYVNMFASGKLKACDAPPPVEKPALTPDEENTIREMRAKALKDAELAIKMYGPKAAAAAPAPDQTEKPDLDEMFGKE